MRRFSLLLLLALLVALEVDGQRQVCEPGSVFRVSCNTCRCNESGTDMACTRKECPEDYLEEGKRVCVPGTVYKMDCNECRCSEDGTKAACTLRAC